MYLRSLFCVLVCFGVLLSAFCILCVLVDICGELALCLFVCFFYVMVVVFLSLAFGLVCILSVWFDSCVLNFVVAFDVPVRRVC